MRKMERERGVCHVYTHIITYTICRPVFRKNSLTAMHMIRIVGLTVFFVSYLRKIA